MHLYCCCISRVVEGDRGGGNLGEWGREVGGKREETGRDAGVMWGREVGEEWETLSFLMTF